MSLVMISLYYNVDVRGDRSSGIQKINFDILQSLLKRSIFPFFKSIFEISVNNYPLYRIPTGVHFVPSMRYNAPTLCVQKVLLKMF